MVLVSVRTNGDLSKFVESNDGVKLEAVACLPISAFSRHRFVSFCSFCYFFYFNLVL